MIEKLKEKLDSMIKVFEVLYVLSGVKQSARIMVSEDDYLDIKSFLESYNLCIAGSNFKVLKLDNGAYSNKGERISCDDNRKGHFFMYVAKSDDIITKLQKYEETFDHINLGLTLGYPRCCCNFFQKHSKQQEMKNNDYILPAINNSDGCIYPFYNNFTARYFDLTLISHFPCNFNCQKSLDIGKKNLAVIESHSSEYAGVLRAMLKCGVVYTENYGVFLLRNSRLNGDEIIYDSILGNAENNLSGLLKKNHAIQIKNKHCIQIGSEKITTKNMGFLLFI
ncbi:MAG: hypothetical protein ABIC04_06585 [Nanoarchaeota archaeon]